MCERIHYVELCLDNRNDHHLGNAVTRPYGELRTAAIPAGYEQLPLIVGINQPRQIAEHNTLSVSGSGSRYQNRRKSRIGDMDCNSGRNQFRLSGLQCQRLINAGAQVKSRRTRRGIPRQAEFVFYPRIQNPYVNSLFQRRYLAAI